MIKSITLSNFFSFAEKQTVELDPYVNILIGINGSGKSNFIKAIELLSRGIEDDGAQEVINEWGGLNHVKSYKFHNDETPVELIFNFSDFKYNLSLLKKNKSEKAVLIKQELSSFKSEINQDKLSEQLHNEIEGITVYNEMDISNMRVKTFLYNKNNTRLAPSMDNLGSILYYLSVYYPDYETIKKLLKNINPHFNELSFNTQNDNEVQMNLGESGFDTKISLRNISKGTLKFLALLAILYNPNRGKIIFLKEPEQSLHPDMIRTIAKGIKHAARTGTQMIVATHSPFLLDSFLVDDVLVFEKNKNNETRVMRKTEEDYENWLNDYTTGDLWMSGKMGGVRH